MLLGLIDTAEGAARRQPRVLGRQAVGAEFLLEQAEMRVHFTREVVFRAIAAEDRDETQQKLPD